MDMIRFILENQITAEAWYDIAEEAPMLLGDHKKLIRALAMYVSENKAGSGTERRQLLGIYYDETQAKVTWAYRTAQDVWKGKYGNGEEHRRSIFGADYELVKFWVNALKPGMYVPSNITVTDTNGVYRTKGIPTAAGTKTWIGFDQHNSGSSYRLSGSGCGLCSFLSVIATFKDSSIRPQAWCKSSLTAVTGFSACPISITAGTKILQKYGIGFERVKTFDTDTAFQDIRAHLLQGRPVVVSLSCRNRAGKKTNSYTNSGHYSLLIGVRADGKAFLMDSGSRKPRWVDLWDLCDHIPVNNASGETRQTWVWQGEGGYEKIFM